MEWKQFIADLVSSLAWPVSVAVIVCVFRSEFVRILQRLAHFKYKDLELDFEKFKQHAEEIHDELPQTKQELPQAEPSMRSPAVASLDDQIWDAVERAPSAAILLAWSTVASAMAAAVSRLPISREPPFYRSAWLNLEMLSTRVDMPARYVALLNEMRILRNKVAHDPEAVQSITEEQARSYAGLAKDMVRYLDTLSRED